MNILHVETLHIKHYWSGLEERVWQLWLQNSCQHAFNPTQKWTALLRKQGWRFVTTWALEDRKNVISTVWGRLCCSLFQVPIHDTFDSSSWLSLFDKCGTYLASSVVTSMTLFNVLFWKGWVTAPFFNKNPFNSFQSRVLWLFSLFFGFEIIWDPFYSSTWFIFLILIWPSASSVVLRLNRNARSFGIVFFFFSSSSLLLQLERRKACIFEWERYWNICYGWERAVHLD